jgi:hypothetical protein
VETSERTAFAFDFSDFSTREAGDRLPVGGSACQNDSRREFFGKLFV